MSDARGGWQYWDDRAEDFDRSTDKIVGSETEAMVQTWLVERLRPEDVVVELACGTGRYSALMAPKVAAVTATDQSPRMLELAKAKLAAFETVTVQRADATSTGLAEGSFDLVVMANLLHVVPDPSKVMAEAARLLTPGGRAIAIDYTVEGMSVLELPKMLARMLRSWGRPSADNKRLNRVDLQQLAADAGLGVDSCALLGAQTKAVVMAASKPS